MTIVEKARKVLDLKKLELPKSPRIVGLEVENYVDWAGDDSLRVYLIISDDATDEEIVGTGLRQFTRSIHERLLAAGIERFPYVRLRTETERREELAEQRA